jgi:polar amino acid transport system permease protein
VSEFLHGLVENLPEWLPQLLVACGETLQLTAASFVIAAAGGVLVALLRRSGSPVLRAAAIVYIEIARGMPALVILFLIYFALPTALPALQFDSFTAATIGLGLQGAALLGEIFRAGLEAVDRGQREAALTLGLTPRQSLLYVVAPQAARVVLAPTGNYVIGLLKDTSIASIIAAPDLMLRAKDLASSSFLPMQLYVLAAVLYFAMSWPLARLVRRLELAYAAPHRP